MPSASTRSTLSRQWELPRILPIRIPEMTFSQLCQGLADAGHTVSKPVFEYVEGLQLHVLFFDWMTVT